MKSGKPSKRSIRLHLGKRDRAILDEVVRYRVLTNELVHLRHLPFASINAATKVTHRLTEGGWLQRYEYICGRWYFVPGKKLCQHLGLPSARVRPLGCQTLVTAMALAHYCLKAALGCKLLRSDELARDWQWIPDKLRTLPHAVDAAIDTGHEQTSLLRLIRVDLGGTPAHVAQKCLYDFKQRLPLREFTRRLVQRQLIYVVLTATETKKQLIMRELKKRQWPTGARFEISVVPELCFLLD